jgi:uncharacterized protein involved in response to NO
MTTIQATRQAAPHPFLSFAFRPFFLAAGLFAALVVLAWLPMVLAGLELPIAITPRDWHVHEMLYGYATAAIAGFLFTAIPNWTGRPPVSGPLLLALLLAWIGGRLAMATSALIGLPLAVAVDLLFLPLVAAVAGREIVAAGNRRNFKLLGVLALLTAGNVVFHVETISEGIADYGLRLGLATVIGLIILIGGRIVPNFTRNALMRAKPGRLPELFGRFDVAAIAVSVAALALWVALPQSAVTGVIALLAALLQAMRLARWAGDRAIGDWLVLVLHVAYGFVALGFLLAGVAALAPQAPMIGAAAHAWGAGAIGLMTLAVMTRATLGHTGRPLAASRGTIVVYQLAILAALARLGAILPSAFDTLLLEFAAAAWIAAFAGFVAIYGPMMLRPPLTVNRGC